MPFILALSLYFRYFRSVIDNDNTMDLSIADRNLTKVEWEKLVNHPFNEYEW